MQTIAHHDCLDSLRWVISNCEKLGVDPNRIIIAGDSAGGNLCASIGVMAANENIQIRCLVMIYPMTTMTYDILSLDENGDGLLKPGQVKPPSPFYSWIENASGPFLQTVDIQWCGSLYAKDESAILGKLDCYSGFDLYQQVYQHLTKIPTFISK